MDDSFLLYRYSVFQQLERVYFGQLYKPFHWRKQERGTHSKRFYSTRFFVGFFVSLLSTVLGTLGAIGLHAIHSKRIKAAYSTVNQIPMINSEIVTAIALALVFNLFASTFRINDGSWGMTAFKLILAQTSFCAPYVLLNVLPRLQKSDNKIYEAALDLGCTPAKAMFKVVLPDILPGIIVGALLSFTLSIDDFVITKIKRNVFRYSLNYALRT